MEHLGLILFKIQRPFYCNTGRQFVTLCLNFEGDMVVKIFEETEFQRVWATWRCLKHVAFVEWVLVSIQDIGEREFAV